MLDCHGGRMLVGHWLKSLISILALETLTYAVRKEFVKNGDIEEALEV